MGCKTAMAIFGIFNNCCYHQGKVVVQDLVVDHSICNVVVTSLYISALKKCFIKEGFSVTFMI